MSDLSGPEDETALHALSEALELLERAGDTLEPLMTTVPGGPLEVDGPVRSPAFAAFGHVARAERELQRLLLAIATDGLLDADRECAAP